MWPVLASGSIAGKLEQMASIKEVFGVLARALLGAFVGVVFGLFGGLLCVLAFWLLDYEFVVFFIMMCATILGIPIGISSCIVARPREASVVGAVAGLLVGLGLFGATEDLWMSVRAIGCLSSVLALEAFMAGLYGREVLRRKAQSTASSSGRDITQQMKQDPPEMR